MEISEQQYKAISKYWEKHGGPNFFDTTPFRMFNIPNNRDAILELAKRYYGEENWYNQIKSHIGKIYNLKTPHYDIDYKIADIDQYDEGDIDRIEVKIDQNGKIDIGGGRNLTIKEIYECEDVYEFLKKYHPEVDEDSELYDEMAYNIDKEFFDGNNWLVESMEENILSRLSTIITKPYGAQIDYVVLENGNDEDFDRQLKMFEQFNRIKILINFSDY